ncbi:MAG: TraG/TraD/VirD4 family protein [Firmicutes bacterium]|nr:TraG/TraD/VirD4 family protein [Bacillota bacterium]MCL5013767.1 TraG/TraD/VirD4 family protein [Bacillota bacterium]
MDESSNLPPFADFDHSVTVSAGMGIRPVLALQNIEQPRKHYERTERTIRGNLGTWARWESAPRLPYLHQNRPDGRWLIISFVLAGLLLGVNALIPLTIPGLWRLPVRVGYGAGLLSLARGMLIGGKIVGLPE